MKRKRKRKQKFKLMSAPTHAPLSHLPCIPFDEFIEAVQAFYDRQIEYFKKTEPVYSADETIAEIEARKLAVVRELVG